MMSLSTILVIPSAILSLTPISARRKTFYLLDSSWALLLVVISGSMVMESVLLRLLAAFDAASMSLFLILMVDLYSLRALLVSLASTFMTPDESSNN